MTDSTTPTGAGTADATPQDIRSLADGLPDDVFGFGGAEDETGDDERAQEPARAERVRQQPRGEGGRFASQDQDGDRDHESDGQGATEAEGETGETEEGEPAQAQEAAEAEPKDKKTEPSVYVEIDGQRYTAEDVRRGFLRQDDYARKTQELSQGQQALHGEAQRLQAHEQELVGVLDVAVAAIRNTLPPQPDMALLDSDPIAYSRQMAQHQAGVQRLQDLVAHQHQAGQRQSAQQQKLAQQENLREKQRRDEAQQTLRQKMPTLFTEQGRTDFLSRVEKHSGALGLDRADIDQIQDPRAFPVLEMAMKWLDLQARKPAAVQRAQAAPPIRPAARPGAGTRKSQAQRDAEARFAKDPSVKNALATGIFDGVFG